MRFNFGTLIFDTKISTHVDLETHETASFTPTTKYTQSNEINNFYEYSKENLTQRNPKYHVEVNRNSQQSKYINKSVRKAKKKISRNTSMAHLSNSKAGASIHNISQTGKHKKKVRAAARRKSFGTLRMASSSFKVPRTYYCTNIAKSSRIQNTRDHCASKGGLRYRANLNESSINRDITSEYTYGKAGSAFSRMAKVSNFDVEKERICSPGPAKYVPRTIEQNTKYSFGKQKKDFSFVTGESKEVPAPGKYIIKRDFLSRKMDHKQRTPL